MNGLIAVMLEHCVLRRYSLDMLHDSLGEGGTNSTHFIRTAVYTLVSFIVYTQ